MKRLLVLVLVLAACGSAGGDQGGAGSASSVETPTVETEESQSAGEETEDSVLETLYPNRVAECRVEEGYDRLFFYICGEGDLPLPIEDIVAIKQIMEMSFHDLSIAYSANGVQMDMSVQVNPHAQIMFITFSEDDPIPRLFGDEYSRFSHITMYFDEAPAVSYINVNLSIDPIPPKRRIITEVAQGSTIVTVNEEHNLLAQEIFANSVSHIMTTEDRPKTSNVVIDMSEGVEPLSGKWPVIWEEFLDIHLPVY